MPNKPLTTFSALATLVCAAWSAQAAPAEQPVDSSRTGKQAEFCHLQALFSASSDFVVVPYTFGGRLDYRPVIVDQETPCPFAGAPLPTGRETKSDIGGIE
jgi:hypothetical protein